MLKKWRTFFKKFYVTRVTCALMLVSNIMFVSGCASEMSPKNTGEEATRIEQMTEGCWTCSMFQKVYQAANSAAGGVVPSVAKSAVGLVAVGYGLWLAVFILKYVSSLQEPDVGAFWKTLATRTFWLVLGVALLRDLASGGSASALKMFAEPVFSGFVDAGLAIVQGTGGEVSCSPGGGAESGLLCLVKALEEKLNFGAGISLMGVFLGPTIFVMLIGLIVFIISLILMIYLPILMLDGVFRYGIALCMLPLAVAAYIFVPTRNFTGKVASLFLEIGFYIMGMCAFAACAVQIIHDYIDRFLPFVKNPLFFIGNPNELERVLCGPGMTGLIFLGFFLVLFGEVIGDFMRAISGGAGGMGNTAKGAIGAVKNTAALAKKAANFGFNTVQRYKDRKAALLYKDKNADKNSKEYKAATDRLKRRGYLAYAKNNKASSFGERVFGDKTSGALNDWKKGQNALGKDASGTHGVLLTTKAFDNLTRNDDMKGPFKGIRRLANNLDDISQDWNQSALSQSDARHDHEDGKGANAFNTNKDSFGQEQSKGGGNAHDVIRKAKGGKGGDLEYARVTDKKG